LARQVLGAVQHQFDRDGIVLHSFAQAGTAPLPGGQDDEERRTHHKRQPAAVRDLDRVGQEEGAVHQQEYPGQKPDPAPPPAPYAAHHHAGKDGGDQHGPGDRDPIGGRQITRRTEQEDEHDHGNHQHPVDGRDVDLPHFAVGRMLDMHARQIAKLNRLLRDREGTGNDRLRRDDGRGHGKDDQRQRRP
jgi:hypothetical protein